MDRPSRNNDDDNKSVNLIDFGDSDESEDRNDRESIADATTREKIDSEKNYEAEPDSEERSEDDALGYES